MPLAEAKKLPGVRAVFGEKYPDPVRVAADRRREARARRRADMSVEFCGGTHLSHTGQAGFFKIVGQEHVAKGVRRVTAVTGQRAVDAVQEMSDVARRPDRPVQLPAGRAADARRGAAGGDQEAAAAAQEGRGRRPERGRPTSCSPRPRRSTAPSSSSARCPAAPVERCATRSTGCGRRPGVAHRPRLEERRRQGGPGGRRDRRPGQEGASSRTTSSSRSPR